MKNTLLFLILLPTLFCTSQEDTLNKFNDKKKKTGYWVEYFDQNILPTDSANSFFYGFQLYDNGTKVYSFGVLKEKRKLILDDSIPLPEKGCPVPVNGVFKWYYKDHALRIEEKYVAGIPSVYKYYMQRVHTDKTNVISEVIYFNKRYNNIPGTFYQELYFLYSERKIQLWYYKSKNKWKSHRIK